LERQKNSLLYERLALSKDKKGLMKLATKGHAVQHPADVKQFKTGIEGNSGTPADALRKVVVWWRQNTRVTDCGHPGASYERQKKHGKSADTRARRRHQATVSVSLGTAR